MPTVLVTGANRGLGYEFARQYSADGWRVLAVCRKPSAELEKLDNVSVHLLDVTDHKAIEALADTLSGVAIDVLINNAGVNGQTSFEDRGFGNQAFGNTDYENWRNTLEINLLAPMKMAESFVEHVAASQEKKILTLTSQVGSIAENTSGGFYRYRASKAGVNAIMKSMSIDLLPREILALSLHPGWVRTDLGGENAEISPETSVTGMREVIANLTADKLGDVIAYSGETVPY